MKLSKAITRYEYSITVESTRKLYTYTLASLLDSLDNIPIKTITTDMLRGWRISLESSRSRSTRNRGQKLSVYTVHRSVRVVKQFFKWLTAEGHLDTSPAARLEFPRLPKGEPPKAISDADLERMIETARTEAETGERDALRDYALLRFLAETGCRAGGLVGVRFEDMDLDGCSAIVREKGERSRSVSFGPETAKALRCWLVVRSRRKGGDIVFTGKRGPLSVSGVYRILERLAERALVVGRHNPHAFRHALARRLLQNKADLGTVAEILGHADVGTTHKFYARWSSGELKARHKEFGGILE